LLKKGDASVIIGLWLEISRKGAKMQRRFGMSEILAMLFAIATGFPC